jgi:flagellar basal body-associated protein FliL
MLRSLRGRLIVLLVLLVVAAGATATLMIGLFHQSAAARVGQAAAENSRAPPAWRRPDGALVLAR